MPRTTCNELHTPRTRWSVQRRYAYACVAEQRNNALNAVARLPSDERLHRGARPGMRMRFYRAARITSLRTQLCSSPGPSPPERMLTLEV